MMTEKNIDEIAYVKYQGGSADEGILGINDTAAALEGFDEMFKYFLSHEDLTLSNIDFDIPARIKQGSIEISIPDSIASWLLTAGGTTLTAYLGYTAKQAAKDGFLSTGAVKDVELIFKKTFDLIMRSIKIAKHIGNFEQRSFDNVKFRNQNTEVIILNNKNEELYVPVKYLDIYKKCPKKVFSKIVQPVTDSRDVEIGVLRNGSFVKEKITIKERNIFYFGDKDGNILFPELKHGESVEIEGEITRATENTQTIGFKYKNHILTCKPNEGGIVAFKNQIISQKDSHIYNTKAKIKGIVDRQGVDGQFKEKRPQIIFSEIISLESDNKVKLFN